MARPRKKAELIEGPQAFEKFHAGMKALFRVSKAEVEEAERKDRASRKRKKAR